MHLVLQLDFIYIFLLNCKCRSICQVLSFLHRKLYQKVSSLVNVKHASFSPHMTKLTLGFYVMFYLLLSNRFQSPTATMTKENKPSVQTWTGTVTNGVSCRRQLMETVICQTCVFWWGLGWKTAKRREKRFSADILVEGKSAKIQPQKDGGKFKSLQFKKKGFL